MFKKEHRRKRRLAPKPSDVDHVIFAIENAYDNGYAVLDMDDEQLAIDLNRYDARCGWYTHEYLLVLVRAARPILKKKGYHSPTNVTKDDTPLV